jgi:hypothetical protein
MSNFDELFGTTHTEELHPAARAWLSRIRAGQPAQVEVVRKREGLSFAPPKLYITFGTPTGPEVQSDQWDPHLSEVLARAGVRAASRDNEALRTALMLEEWFGFVHQRYGDHYVDLILLDYVAQSAFSRYPSIQEILKAIYRPERSYGDSHGRCLEDITAVLSKAAKTLTEMRYERPEAEAILSHAVAMHLDDRFNVTNRRLLGFR